jgi:hypothetical protein
MTDPGHCANRGAPLQPEQPTRPPVLREVRGGLAGGQTARGRTVDQARKERGAA